MPYFDALFAAARLWAADPAFWAVGLFTIGAISFSKGAFGGGAASIGVPTLSLIMDPLGAAILVAPLVSFMDMFVLRSFGPSTWSKPDLRVLLPGLIVGLGLGWLLFDRADPRWVALLIGAISLVFAAHYFWRRFHGRNQGATPGHPVQPVLALTAGTASGFTTFIAHAGGPPVALYLARRGLDKAAFVGTNTAIFTLGNLLKLGPYGVLLAARPDAAAGALLLAPIVPFAVHLGVKTFERLSQPAILLAVHLLLAAGGARLVYAAARSLWP